MLSYIEYDEDGNPQRQEVAEDPGALALFRLSSEKAEEELLKLGLPRRRALSHLRISVTGAKELPDNAKEASMYLFWAQVSGENRRICSVRELGGWWRIGAGIRFGRVIYGAWLPWRRPRRPRLDIPERMDISPAELLGGLT